MHNANTLSYLKVKVDKPTLNIEMDWHAAILDE